MRTSPRLQLFLLTVIGLLVTPVTRAGGQSANTIVCESPDGEYHRCDVSTQGNVKLLRRLSWVACEQGTTWGFDPRGIWVDQGCSAEFSYGRVTASNTSSSSARTLVCESLNNQYRYCQAPTQGTASLRRRLTTAACVEGESWGYDNNGIWVTDNCRAEFAYGRSTATAAKPDSSLAAEKKPAASLTCESTGGAYQLCKADTRGNVRLTQQISRTGCVQGQTWGFDNTGIWVTGGCRARFAYGIAQEPASSASNATAATTTTVTCESAGGEGKRCKIADPGNANVRLKQQLSRSECVQGQTWGVDKHSLWVTGGCRAVFTVTQKAAASSTSLQQSDGGTAASSTNSNAAAAAATVPSWLVGTFSGYNPLYDAGMQITIGRDGRVSAIVEGARLNGWYEEGKMVLGGVNYTLRREQNGFRTIQENDPGNQVIYTRTR